MCLRDRVWGYVGDMGKRRPVVLIGIGVLCASFLVILQRDARKAGAETRHPLEVPLLWHERSAIFLPPPAETSLPFQGPFVTVDAKENRTDDVKLCDENVDERDAFPTEIVQCEDMTCNGTQIVGYKRLDTSFVDELGDHSFCKNIEKVDK